MGQMAVLQKEIWANKVSKGFDKTTVDREFNLTYGELAEAYDAYIKTEGTVGEELADVMIYIMGIAEKLGIDLEKEVLDKIEINKNRKYKQSNGHFIKEVKR
jgi:NTP pyrophosphatase (non-canonical NTP hydrolase)